MKSSSARGIFPFFVGVSCYAIGALHQPVLDPVHEDLAMLNGCVVSACNYSAIVKAQHTLDPHFWAKILLVRYVGRSAGHAYCVWETDGTLYGYDRNSGGFPIPGAFTREPRDIAAVLAQGLSHHLKVPLTVASAEFVERSGSELSQF